MPNFNGKVEIQDAGGGATIVLDGDGGDVTIGGSSQDGVLLVNSGTGVKRFVVDAASGDVMVTAPDGSPIVTVGGATGDIVAHRKVVGIDREIFRFDATNAALYLGGEFIEGDLVVRDEANKERIKLDGGAGDIWVRDTFGNLLFQFNSANAGLFVGGAGVEGDVVVRDATEKERVKLDGGAGDIWVKDANGNLLLHFNSSNAGLFVGGKGKEGDVVVRDANEKERVKLDGGDGDIWVKDANGNLLFQFHTANGGLFVGGKSKKGDVVVRDSFENERIKLDGGASDIWVRDLKGNHILHFNGANAGLFVGGAGNEGDVVVRDQAERERIKLDGAEGDIWVKDEKGNLLFHFDCQFAALYLGGAGNEGDLVVRDEGNRERIKLDGGEGDIWVKDTAGNLLFHFDSEFAALYLGGSGNEGDLIVRNASGNQTIKLDGGAGDIILNNADAAEDFEIANVDRATPGMVMVLDDDGRLEPCSHAYDRKVVGVVSGAGRYRPGIVFDRGATRDPHHAPISMMGKVACRADASYGAIGVGDLLTTSPSPGCAMRAADPARAFGAVIGKALSRLDEGEGLISMLISLQ